ncbi:MAG TPA: prephenate dehydrogenase [Actinomycetota bacterium]|nr:prephenate dehydrogenase [Actinomycetota bacterium]
MPAPKVNTGASIGPQLDCIAILGLGLMGGSLGMACLQRGLVEEVAGYDLDPHTMARALERGAITRTAPNPRDAVAGAGIVFIATPVSAIVSTFGEALPAIPVGALVTDVGSTKTEVVEEVSRLTPSTVEFIGGHPIAGSERQGIEAASADLYDGCLWILTPTQETSTAAYQRLMRFLSGLGARVLSLDPARHDEALALTSHLPQLVSSTLMRFAADVAADGDGLPLLTAGGFRDMTRIAASSEEMWIDIVKQNRPALLNLMRKFQAAFDSAARALAQGDWDSLRESLASARRARNALPGKVGIEPSEMVEVLVPVPDRPGVLAEVTTTVGEAGVNIEDLDIVHSAEGGRGVIHLSVRGRSSAEIALRAIEKKGFKAELS